MRAATSEVHAEKASLFSSAKQRGSLPICYDMMAGSSLYGLLVYLLVREMMYFT
jgi:hypothetical protein